MISVIVPVYNVENYIDECIKSILDQTFKDFELILVDDGSPDTCGSICDEFAAQDTRVKVIHKANGGLSDARNVGIAASRGDFITLIDSDDVIPPYYLEHLIRGLTSHNADICICWFQKFEEIFAFVENQSYVEKRVMSGREACMNIYKIQDRVSTSACTKLYKAKLFEGIQYPVGRIHEDEATTHKLLYSASKVVELDEALYYYRVTPNSIMNSPFSLRRYDAITALYERYMFFSDKGEIELAKKTKQALDLLKAKFSIRARNSGIYDQVPPEYRMSTLRALAVIHKYSDPDNFEWFLSLIFPKLVKPYEYIRKINTILRK